MILNIPGLMPPSSASEDFCLPESVRFVSPGLPDTDGDRFFVSGELPFAPRVAAACLGELLSMGETVSSPRELVTLAVNTRLQAGLSGKASSSHNVGKDECNDIDAFAASGAYESMKGQRADIDDAQALARASAEAAQKVLILAWSLEERMRELAALSQNFSDINSLFDDAVGVDERGDFPGLDDIRGGFPDLGDVQGTVPWRKVFEAVVRFAPVEAAFVTCDAEMVAAITETGKASALDADTAKRLGWTGKTDVAVCTLPAWQVTGHSRVPEDKPWLERDVSLIVCSCAKDGNV